MLMKQVVAPMQRVVLMSWAPSIYEPAAGDPVELYDYQSTMAKVGIYVNEDQVAAVDNTPEKAMARLKAFLDESGYLEDTYGDAQPVWSKAQFPYWGQVLPEIESGSWEHLK